jgi:mannobiose 2-epimerase
MGNLSQALSRLEASLNLELRDILEFWTLYTVDEVQGGFIGRLGPDNIPSPEAPKGSVLNARILWTFSAASVHLKDPGYLPLAKRAYHYLQEYFTDPAYGGVYWTVDHLGRPLDAKKQTYAQAFAIYGFAEYYRASGDPEALDAAIRLFRLLENYCYDPVHTGYIDAFSRDWGPMEDIRLSEKDANEKKTMNTHLHVLEAYTALYRVWPDTVLEEKLRLLVDNFTTHIVDPASGHLRLFFDEQWDVKSTVVSYGHDIEASWLLSEATEVIGDEKLSEAIDGRSLAIAKASTEGLDDDGGLWYELAAGSMVAEKHWWPQAEAIVGFLHAYEVGGDTDYLNHALESWAFIAGRIKSPSGEWIWGVDGEGRAMPGQDKAGLWKCPYHNGRACIEGINRIKRILPFIGKD